MIYKINFGKENQMKNPFAKKEERRRYKRVAVALTVRYRDLQTNTNFTTGSLSKNISEGGACFSSHEFIPKRHHMIVEIILPTTPEPIKAISKVAWIGTPPDGDGYQIGNQFCEISKEDRDRIERFINQLS